MSLAAFTLMAAASQAGASEDWEFSLSPLFLWGLSIDGDATINGNTAPLDLNFKDDILENMEAVFTFHFEARKGDWTFFTEYQYVDLDPDVDVSVGPLSINADVGFKETTLEIGASWAMWENERTRWELIGGGRYSDQEVDVDLQISGPLPPQLPSKNLEGGDDWWHGFGGVRVIHELSDNWTFIGRGDYGYGGSDNSAWNLAFMFDYRFRDWGSVFIGGRYLDYDYDKRSYGFQAAKAGPLAGITLHW